jgi:hypothetical protein
VDPLRVTGAVGPLRTPAIASPARIRDTSAVSCSAAAAGRSVWIGFVDAHGVAGERVLAPRSVGAGVVEGRDAVDGDVHRVPLHRITSIALVEDPEN